MRDSNWKKWDKLFYKFEKKALIPNYNLKNVKFVQFKNKKDIEKIPSEGGCYWIWTNEPVFHSLHKRKTPKKFDSGEIIYNGLAKDNIRYRIKNHLISDFEAGWSGISVDIYTAKGTKSHRKKVIHKTGKVPYLQGKRMKFKEDIFKLYLSNDEKKYIEKNKSPFYFRNGINIFENKHRKFKFRVYFITNLNSISYGGVIEKLWRKKHGHPKLISFISGR